MKFMMRFAAMALLSGSAMVSLSAGEATAQGVDRYQFLQLEKDVKALNAEVARLRGSAGGPTGQRLNAVEDEIQRLTAQIERLEYAQRQHEAESKKKLEDLEYRIIELEGGDPSILFQNQDEKQGALAPGGAAPLDAAPAPSGGGSLGVITSTATVPGGEQDALDAGIAAIQGRRIEEGKQILSGILSNNPGTPLAPQVQYWLGEARFQAGEYQAAAKSYLDGATINAGAPTAPASLMKLGVTLGLLGKNDVACSTLREVGVRYPQSGEVISRANLEMSRIGC